MKKSSQSVKSSQSTPPTALQEAMPKIAIAGAIIIVILMGILFYPAKVKAPATISEVTSSSPVPSPEPLAALPELAPSVAKDWPTTSFPLIGFSLKVPPDWMVLTNNPKTAKVTWDRVDESSEQYGGQIVLNGPGVYIGSTAYLKQMNLNSQNDLLDIAQSEEIIDVNFGYNGFLDEAAYLDDRNFTREGITYSPITIDGKEIIFAQGGTLTEAFIPYKDNNGRTYGMILVSEKPETKEILKNILSTMKFTK